MFAGHYGVGLGALVIVAAGRAAPAPRAAMGR
jgi:hypothetical protein